MEAAKLVAIGISKISEVELAEPALTIARRILTRCTACFNAGLMPCVNFPGSIEVEADGGPVCDARGLTIDGLSHHEHRSAFAVCNPALVIRLSILAE